MVTYHDHVLYNRLKVSNPLTIRYDWLTAVVYLSMCEKTPRPGEAFRATSTCNRCEVPRQPEERCPLCSRPKAVWRRRNTVTMQNSWHMPPRAHTRTTGGCTTTTKNNGERHLDALESRGVAERRCSRAMKNNVCQERDTTRNTPKPINTAIIAIDTPPLPFFSCFLMVAVVAVKIVVEQAATADATMGARAWSRLTTGIVRLTGGYGYERFSRGRRVQTQSERGP